MKIPIYLITGFLGSGKTTCIDRILKTFDQKYRVGIVQNEFAPANVDGLELRNSGRSFEMLEINNGSIFCICLLDNFIQALDSFIIEKKPDLIIIEASGLSDPSSIIEILHNPLIKDLVFLKETWCIVDAFHFLKMEKLMNRIRHQVVIADRILINKTDLISPAIVSRVREKIKEINPMAGLLETQFCNITLPVSEGNPDFVPLAGKIEREIREIEQYRPEMGVGVFKSGRKISYEALKKLIHDYTRNTIRIKGNVLLENGKTVIVQTVYKKINIKTTDKMLGNTCLILMGQNFNLSEFSREYRAMTLEK